MSAGVRKRRLGQAARLAAIYLALAGLLLIFLFPLAWVVGISLKTRLQVFTSPPLFLWSPTLENYANVLRTTGFFAACLNSLLISTGAVALSLCAGVPAAYAIARFAFRGRSLVYNALLLMRMLPPIAILLPMYILFVKLGMAQSRLSVMLAYTTFSLPLVVWVMRSFFEELPFELEESAWIDGASRLRTFLVVVLPLAPPRPSSGRHSVTVAGLERFPVCRRADRQPDADLAGAAGRLLHRGQRHRLGRSRRQRHAGGDAGHPHRLPGAATSRCRTFLRRSQRVRSQE